MPVDRGSQVSTAVAWCVIALCGALLCVPVWLNGPVAGQDDFIHLNWSREFATQFWQGELYPRWLEHMNGGLGSPTFFFYPPLPYHVASLFHPLTAASGDAWHALSAGAVMAMIASGIAAFTWLASSNPSRAALAGSILYMALPYHLGADLYFRFAYAELWAFAWMPLVLHAARPLTSTRTFTEAARVIVCVALPFALLCLSHLPTMVMFAALPLLQVVVLSRTELRLAGAATVLMGLVLGFGLAAVYLLPAWGDRDFVSMRGIATGVYHYTNNFLFHDPVGHDPRFWRVLETCATLSAAAGVYVLATQWRKAGRVSYISLFWMAILGAATIMTTSLAIPAWELLPFLQNVQFPWRFETIGTLAVAALVTQTVAEAQTMASRGTQDATGFTLFKSGARLGLAILPLLVLIAMQWYRNQSVWFSLLIALVALSACALLAMRHGERTLASTAISGIAAVWLMLLLPNLGPAWAELGFLTRAPDSTSRRPGTTQLPMVDQPEYRIRSVPESAFSADFMRERATPGNYLTIISGKGQLQIVSRKPRAVTVAVRADEPVQATLGRYFYPGTVLRGLTGDTPGAITPTEQKGLVQIGFPSGEYTAVVALMPGTMEKTGRRISLLALSVAALLGFYGFGQPSRLQRRLTKQFPARISG